MHHNGTLVTFTAVIYRWIHRITHSNDRTEVLESSSSTDKWAISMVFSLFIYSFMSFLTGFSFLLIVLLSTAAVHLLRNIFKGEEFLLLPLVFMLFFDGLACLTFYMSFVELVESVKTFKLGISAAFAMGTLARVLYLAATYSLDSQQ